MVAVPPCLSATVCGLPGCSAKVGGTMGFAVLSAVFDITQNIINKESKNSYSILYGIVAAMSVQIVIVFISIFISYFRLGNGKYEKGKILY